MIKVQLIYKNKTITQEILKCFTDLKETIKNIFFGFTATTNSFYTASTTVISNINHILPNGILLMWLGFWQIQKTSLKTIPCMESRPIKN